MTSTDDSSSDWSDEDKRTFLAKSLRHVVAIALTLREKGEERFVCFSAFVVIVRDTWWLVTAGHIISELKPRIENGDVEVLGRSLADYFGEGASHFQPIPFDLFSQDMVHVYDEDMKLDFALVRLEDLYKKNLEANGIIPLPVDWSRATFDGVDSCGVVGFPAEAAKASEATFGGQAKAVFVPLKRKETTTPDSQFPRLVAEILDMGTQASIVGMSGGPIFTYQTVDGQLKYEVVAIQGSWNKKNIVYGCPLALVFSLMTEAMRSVGQ